MNWSYPRRCALSGTCSSGPYLYTSKTKVMHISALTDCPLALTMEAPAIERVEDFKYLSSYMSTAYNISCQVGQAWGASHGPANMQRALIQKLTKLKVLSLHIDPVLWLIWHTSPTCRSAAAYQRSRVSSTIAVLLSMWWDDADKINAKILLWEPDEKRKFVQPFVTLTNLIKEAACLRCL